LRILPDDYVTPATCDEDCRLPEGGKTVRLSGEIVMPASGAKLAQDNDSYNTSQAPALAPEITISAVCDRAGVDVSGAVPMVVPVA
jgi:hypothetical protein